MKPERRYIIDDVGAVLRKPTAAPILEPAEIIAIVLTATQWTPGRKIEPDDLVVEQMLHSLKQHGWKFEPL
ncbi:hypothetical protein [Bradyrhizobium sp. SZCCHNR1020]|uniref:hypothetical protein n=1 Tax=Bradyrhizobium sp. SZCCHNR1020 TaxID=3057343 RepID=UPI002915F719|nr:hypothetical protein [Bradyrhizobium sp. SZCCHNR1020]